MNDDIKMILRDSRMWGEAPEAMRRLEAELKQATDQWTTWSQLYQEAKAENERLLEEREQARAYVDAVQAENETLRAGNREMWNATSKTEAELIQENERLREALDVVRRSFASEYGPANDEAIGPAWSKPIFDALAQQIGNEAKKWARRESD